MINYIEHTKIDKKKWDACILSSTHPSVFAMSWYLDAVCPVWSALIADEYKTVMPLAGNSKLGINYFYQPLFTRYLGVYSSNTITQQTITAFFESLPQKYKYVEFSIHESNNIENTDFEKKERKFQLLELNRSYENLILDFKGDAKRNIKKAEKNSLTITEDVKPEDVVNLFRNNKGRELKGLQTEDYTTLLELMNAAIKNKSGFILGVKNQMQELVAAGFFITFQKRILFLKGSANNEGKSSGSMYLILNHVFKHHSFNYELFDFGGSSVESVASFNHNFGAKDCVYLQVKRNRLPFFIKLISGKK